MGMRQDILNIGQHLKEGEMRFMIYTKVDVILELKQILTH